MDKSLRMIIYEEDMLVHAINTAKENIQQACACYDDIQTIPIKCESKTADLATYENLIISREKEIAECRVKLEVVRKEMAEYISMLSDIASGLHGISCKLI